MIRVAIVAVILLLAAAPAAVADVLYLANGGRVEGAVRVEGDSYVVEMLNGSARIAVASVVYRQKIPYVTEVYEARRAAMKADDPDAHLRLSLWCRSKGLRDRADAHLEQVLLLDPDHAEARALRGEVKFEGQWVDREAVKDLQMARAGFLRFEGRWFTEAGLAAYLAAKKELFEMEAVAEDRRAAREAEARKAREDEERIAKLAAERKAIEAALKQAEEDRLARDALIRENQRLLDRLLDHRDRGYGYGYDSGWSWPYGMPYFSGSRSLSARCNDLHRVSRGSSLRFSWTRGNFRVRGAVR